LCDDGCQQFLLVSKAVVEGAAGEADLRGEIDEDISARQARFDNASADIGLV
jgi:hypothetical protein